MRVKLAHTAGFCMGVKRAVDIALDMAQRGGEEKIYTYGPLIHNPQTIEILESRGVIPLTDVNGVQDGLVIIRAHGISPEDREKIRHKGIAIVDATCPKVARVQAIIRKHSGSGYTVLIAGDRTHPEVIGLLGYASDRGIVVGGPDEIASLPPLEKVCLVTQTTLNSAVFESIVTAVREKYPGAVIFNTICDSTERRQTEVRNMATEMDAIIIVGGKNSANTRQLAAISRKLGAPTFHVETAAELEALDLGGYERIGVSAGASTPNWITDGVIDYLTHYREGSSRFGLSRLYRFWSFLVRTDLYSAIGAGFLSAASMILQGLALSVLPILIASFYVYAVHAINRLRSRNIARLMGSYRKELYGRHTNLQYTLALACLAVALVLSFLAGPAPFVILLVLSVFGVLYNIRIFPWRRRVDRLADIPGTKSLFVALAWAAATALLPPAGAGGFFEPAAVMAFLFVFTLVFVKSALSDMMDIQSDRLVGEETLPVVLGEAGTKKLLKVMSLAMGLLLVAGYLAGWGAGVAPVLLLPIFYVWICFRVCDKRARFSSIMLEGLLGANYIIAGLVAGLWFMIIARF